MLELACNLVDQMTIGTDAVRVGAVVFGTNANVAIPIGTYVSFYCLRNLDNQAFQCFHPFFITLRLN